MLLLRPRELAIQIRRHVTDRGGPAKDEDGNCVGTVWPMMLEAAGHLETMAAEIERLIRTSGED